MPCPIHKKQYCRKCDYGFCPHSKRKSACSVCREIYVRSRGRIRQRYNCRICDQYLFSTTTIGQHWKTQIHQTNLKKKFTESKLEETPSGNIILHYL